MNRRLAEHIHAFCVRSVGLHEEQVLANRPGKKLSILRDKADAAAEAVDLHFVFRDSVVVNMAGFRTVEADEQFYERGFAGAGGPDESDCLATRHGE